MSKGNPVKINVYRNNRIIDSYDSILDCSRAYYPDKCLQYLNACMKSGNQFFDKSKNITFKKAERGRAYNQKSYRVIEKESGRNYNIYSTRDVLGIIQHGHNSFFRQMRNHKSYKDDKYTIFPF